MRPWTRLEAGLVAAATLVGLWLRLWGYTAAPAPRDNPDEAQFLWLGVSLIRDHLPTTWSTFADYGRPDLLVTADGVHWPLVTPWLDHPPWFGLLIGGVSWLAGVHSLVDTAAWIERLPVIALGAACVPLVHLLGRRALGVPASMAGAWLYATAPGAVLFSRSVEIEAVLAPLFLVALYASHRVMRGEPGRRWLILLLVAGFLSGAFKVNGIVVAGACAVALLAAGRVGPALYSAAAGLAGLLTYAAWGAYWNWGLFLAIVSRQGANRAGVLNGILFITSPAGLNRPLHDGWWLLGWLGAAALLAAPRLSARQLLVAWPLVAYAAAMLVLTDQRVAGFGWYRIAVYPLAYLAAGWLAWLAWRRPSPAALTLVLVAGGAVAAYPLLGGAQQLGLPSGDWAALVIAAGVAVTAWAAWRRPAALALQRGVLAALACLVLLGNVATSLQLSSSYLKL